MTKRITWNEENTAKLQELAGDASVQVSREQVDTIAQEFGASTRSISNKLRNLEYDVQKAAEKASAWSDEAVEQLRSTLEANEGKYTYAELETLLANGFTSRQIQGKVLSMELHGMVRKAEKKEAKRDYTDEEDAKFIDMCKGNASIEQLVEAFGRAPTSIRGKALSLFRKGEIDAIPKQEKSNAKEQRDVLEGLDVANMTVEAIAEATDRSVRGIKSMLSRRGVTAENYDGAAKRAKLDAKKD